MDYSKRTFEQIYKSYYRHMYRLAYALLLDAEDARDAVSHVFAQMWQSQPEVHDEKIKAYLLTATRNKCLHILHQREQRAETEAHFGNNQQLDGDEDRRELLEQLHELIIANLTPRDREILTLHYDEEMTYDETAAALGISPAAVNKHITRSLATLRKKMKWTK